RPARARPGQPGPSAENRGLSRASCIAISLAASLTYLLQHVSIGIELDTPQPVARRAQPGAFRVLAGIGHDDVAEALVAHELADAGLIRRGTHVVVRARVQLVAQALARARIRAERARLDEQVARVARDGGPEELERWHDLPPGWRLGRLDQPAQPGHAEQAPRAEHAQRGAAPPHQPRALGAHARQSGAEPAQQAGSTKLLWRWKGALSRCSQARKSVV